jgi:tRNA 2-thiouridine synthesizing protein A
MGNKPDRTIDLTGKQCPFTILEIGKILRTLQPGQVLEVLADSDALTDDVKAWCAGVGEEFIGAEVQDGIRVYLRKS